MSEQQVSSNDQRATEDRSAPERTKTEIESESGADVPCVPWSPNESTEVQLCPDEQTTASGTGSDSQNNPDALMDRHSELEEDPTADMHSSDSDTGSSENIARNGATSRLQATTPTTGNIKFSIENILRPDFGRTSNDNVMSPSRQRLNDSEDTVCQKPPMLWPAWVYCTRYSDRPSSGNDHVINIIIVYV